MPTPMPTRPAPRLDVPVVGGNRFVLSEQEPDRFALLVFYRGLHCPVCNSYLQELEGVLDDFAGQGADVVVAVSMDDAETAEQTVQDWASIA
jgi:peroxiredoxin